MNKTLTGTVIEVGSIYLRDAQCVPVVGLLIETTGAELRDFAGNLAYAQVVVTLAEDGGE